MPVYGRPFFFAAQHSLVLHGAWPCVALSGRAPRLPATQSPAALHMTLERRLSVLRLSEPFEICCARIFLKQIRACCQIFGRVHKMPPH